MRTSKNRGIWTALAAAMLLHALVLMLPLTRSVSPISNAERIELELIAYLPDPPVAVEFSPGDLPAPSPAQENIYPPVNEPAKPAPPPAPIEVLQQPVVRANTTPADIKNIILSRQFIAEESAADRLFGRPLAIDQSTVRREFHFPARPDMLTMLHAPLPDLPFEYTPGLVHFAYAPGVRGDLQRFWDVITPEFGWRTKNGTEVRCIWLLVVAGCGWK